MFKFPATSQVQLNQINLPFCNADYPKVYVCVKLDGYGAAVVK